jgi:hypothetical protein
MVERKNEKKEGRRKVYVPCCFTSSSWLGISRLDESCMVLVKLMSGNC